MLVVTASTLAVAPSIAGPRDGNAIVGRMIAAYQSARTISETSEAKIAIPGHDVYYQQLAFKFRRPNLLYNSSTDPVGGTLVTVCDGHTITVYNGKENIFTRRAAPVDMRAMLAAASRATEDLVGTAPVPVLSPISFLLAHGVPREADALQLKTTRVVGGHKVATVDGLLAPSWADSFIGTDRASLIKRDVQLSIDLPSYQLLQGSVYLLFRLPPPTGQRQSVTSGVSFTELHKNTRFNQPIPDSAFHFSVPPGAKQMFPEGR